MKASELLDFLQKAIEAYGDTDVNVYACDCRDAYDVQHYHVPIENVRATSALEFNDGAASAEIGIEIRIE